jgi:hypothetical protein
VDDPSDLMTQVDRRQSTSVDQVTWVIHEGDFLFIIYHNCQKIRYMNDKFYLCGHLIIKDGICQSLCSGVAHAFVPVVCSSKKYLHAKFAWVFTVSLFSMKILYMKWIVPLFFFQLLNESEATVMRLTEQAKLLKGEIRRMTRNQERETSVSNMEYLKNIVLKVSSITWLVLINPKFFAVKTINLQVCKIFSSADKVWSPLGYS